MYFSLKPLNNFHQIYIGPLLKGYCQFVQMFCTIEQDGHHSDRAQEKVGALGRLSGERMGTILVKRLED